MSIREQPSRGYPTLLGVLAICFVLGVAYSNARAEESAWTSLAVYPPEISLATSADYQAVVVVATRSDGVTIDATAEAELAVAEASLANFEGTVLRPEFLY